MLRMKKVACLQLLMLLLGFPAMSQACTCAAELALDEALSKSDSVFVGKVNRIEQTVFQDAPFFKIHFNVKEKFKGKNFEHSILRIDRKTTIYTPLSEASCGYQFKSKKHYLVFASKASNGLYVTTLCTRTRLKDEAQKNGDLKLLRKEN